MLFSVIIPTCNRNELLCKCLDLLTPEVQTIDSNYYEVIITDDSKENIAKDLIEKKYSWAKWVTGPQKGPAANRNNGAKQAKNIWLVFIDDDCLPDRNILMEYSLIINENSSINVFEGKTEPERTRQSPIEYAPINLKGGKLWSCNFAIKKQVFDTIDGFDENFKYPHMEDIDFHDRVLEIDQKVLFAANAKVKHPWRKILDGRKLGINQEMYVYYNYKHGKESNLYRLLHSILRFHIRLIRSSLFSIDFFTAIKIMFQHLLTVVFYYNSWKKKYVTKLYLKPRF